MTDMTTLRQPLAALAAALVLAGCATTGDDPRDPWKATTVPCIPSMKACRDKAVFKPLAIGYTTRWPAAGEEVTVGNWPSSATSRMSGPV
ncbi:MAG: hypothetical protein R3E34_02790 [Rhodocyclaceae bacterium]